MKRKLGPRPSQEVRCRRNPRQSWLDRHSFIKSLLLRVKPHDIALVKFVHHDHFEELEFLDFLVESNSHLSRGAKEYGNSGGGEYEGKNKLKGYHFNGGWTS